MVHCLATSTMQRRQQRKLETRYGLLRDMLLQSLNSVVCPHIFVRGREEVDGKTRIIWNPCETSYQRDWFLALVDCLGFSHTEQTSSVSKNVSDFLGKLRKAGLLSWEPANGKYLYRTFILSVVSGLNLFYSFKKFIEVESYSFLQMKRL